VYVPPTQSNIGRIAIIADPQTATLALVEGLSPDLGPGHGEESGQVGWHELLAAEWRPAYAFYEALLGWQKADSDAVQGPADGYQLFAAGQRLLGGMFTKLPRAPFPFWLYYFNVADLTLALQRVTDQGGKLVQGPIELPDGIWIARCIDPQGAMFALQGKRPGATSADAPPLEIGWAAEWGGFASRGRLIEKPQPGTARRGQPKKPPPPR
jgi:predicted enzyme related to lactoylglutathione lyase